VIDLDDRAALRAADPGGMLDTVAGLAAQCREAYATGLATNPLPKGDGIASVAVCGMGGSAIAGDVLAAVAASRLRIPIAVVRTPELPEFCGPHTLLIASSYSGETSETLALFEEAVVRGCRILSITSGGTLGERSAELGVGRVLVPVGFMPRAAFGHLALGALGALEAMGIAPSHADDVDEAVGHMDEVVVESGPDAPTPANPAKALALSIGERVPVVWGADGIASVAAMRWKTQFNENAKIPAFAAALPELDHNEVVGWSPGRGEGFSVIALRHAGEHDDVATRFPLSEEIARRSGAAVHEVEARGRSDLARLLTLVQVGDLVATYLGLARGVDPSPVEAITSLKRALAGT
jgi:glucose/mannose-6-phosphate isomerase